MSTQLSRQIFIKTAVGSAIAPHSLAELSTDVSTSMRLGAAYAHNTSPFSVYAIPSISVPCGQTSTGLPIGLQISGPKRAETLVCQVAAAYESGRWERAAGARGAD